MLRCNHFIFVVFLLISTLFVPYSYSVAGYNNSFYYQQQAMRNQQMMQQQAAMRRQQEAMRRQQEASRRQQAEMRRQQQRQQQMMRKRQQRMQAQMRQRQQQAARQRQQIAERQRKTLEAKNRRLEKRNKIQLSQKMLAKQQQAIRQQQTLRQQRQLKERKDRLNRLQKDRFRKKQANKKRKNADITITRAALQSLRQTKSNISQNFKTASAKQFRQKRLDQQNKQRLTEQFQNQRKKMQARIQKLRDMRKRLVVKKQLEDKNKKTGNEKTQSAKNNNFPSCENGVCKTGNCSFHGDTLVKTLDGFEPIKSLIVGDAQVWARDEITGETNWQPVTALFSNHYDEIVEVSVRDLSNHKQQTIKSNRIHKFYVSDLKKRANDTVIGTNSTGQWLEAQELKKGQRLINANGSESEVVAINVKKSHLKAFNITVDNYHTYFVKEAANDDASAVWVHNSCHNKPFGKLFQKRAQKLRKAMIEFNRVGKPTKVPGGLAGAIRHTIKTGELVGGSDHKQKGLDAIKFYNRQIRQINNSYDIPEKGRQRLIRLATRARNKIQDALDGK